ncbi:hypothetical protein AURDEDRAFT_174777 [Auricularia subglabra TFB-10046 SS5]|uniref:Uncharacterized protein n=1 Tax=Auricularia subglabra (strain TFB-10046 / SS5) TaxID=717982 RepID=J0WSL8_AURST|nr:hypothetical protein AURDEDRAFT_174777 [Auricularia subglabra TFB-10046 SS5]
MGHEAKMKGSPHPGEFQTFWYSNRAFLTSVEPARGSRTFHFEVDKHDGAGPRVQDQRGAGFAVPTAAVTVAEGTCGKDAMGVAVRADAGVRRRGWTSTGSPFGARS